MPSTACSLKMLLYVLLCAYFLCLVPSLPSCFACYQFNLTHFATQLSEAFICSGMAVCLHSVVYELNN